MTRAERIFVASVIFAYVAGYLTWGGYPFYDYPLFTDAPSWHDTYKITDQRFHTIPRSALSFQNSYDGHLTSMIGRRVRTHHHWGPHMTEEELRKIANLYFSDHPETTLLRFERSTYGTLDDGHFGLQETRQWEFDRP